MTENPNSQETTGAPLGPPEVFPNNYVTTLLPVKHRALERDTFGWYLLRSPDGLDFRVPPSAVGYLEIVQPEEPPETGDLPAPKPTPPTPVEGGVPE